MKEERKRAESKQLASLVLIYSLTVCWALSGEVFDSSDLSLLGWMVTSGGCVFYSARTIVRREEEGAMGPAVISWLL